METINFEINEKKYELDMAKMAAAIDSLDNAWQSVALRRLKRGKYYDVLRVLYLCKTGHKINNEDVTSDMIEKVAKELM